MSGQPPALLLPLLSLSGRYSHRPIHLFMHPPIFGPTHSFIHSFRFSIHLSIFPPTYPPTHSSIHASRYSTVYPSTHPWSHTPIHPFMYSSIYPSTHPPTHPSIHPPYKYHCFRHCRYISGKAMGKCLFLQSTPSNDRRERKNK